MEQNDQLKQYRKLAAVNLRTARKAKDFAEQQERVSVAMGYKALAAMEEWLMGLPSKSVRGYRWTSVRQDRFYPGGGGYIDHGWPRHSRHRRTSS